MRLHHSIRTGITAAAALAAIAGTGACLPAVASAVAAPVRLAPALDGAAKGGAVIVVMKDQNAGLSMRAQGTMLRAADRASQASVVSSIRASHGTGLVRLTAPDSVAATLSAAGISKLRSNPAVARVIPDPKVRVAQAVPAPGPAVRQVAASHTWSDSQGCPFNPDPSRPLQEPEADTDIRASDGSPGAPGMGNSIATGAGVVVANEGMDELAGNPNFTRADGSHVVLDAPDYTADDSNDEFYGDASSIAAQGTVDYQYSGALPNAGIPADCTFYIKGDAPGASLLDLSDTPYDPPVQTLAQVVSGIDQAVSENADVISESFGATYIPGSPFSQYFEAADNAAVAAGVTVVASSGDSGDSGTVMAPSADPLVISAGAVDNFRLVAMDDGYRRYVSDNMAALSSGGTAPSGKTVDLVAPGWYGGEAACADGSSGCPASYPTESMRGTSEAAPLIAGAAADVIQAYRDTHHGASPTPAVVKEILTGTATDISAPVDQQGSGLLNVYAAVKAAQQMPGGTAGGGASALIASPSQLDVSGDGGTTSSQSVSLYNAGGSAVAVSGSYRRIGREFRIGKTVTENVSAPDPSQPVPEAGATAASPVTFQVPRHLGRLDVDMIWPDPANSSTLQIQLFNPSGALAQESYDDGSPATARRAGSIPNIQHIEVSAPQAGRWTARILWSGKDQDLALPPIAPGSYAGPMSFRVSGQDWVTRQATTRPVIIGAHASASVPLRVRFPAAPGDHPESVQFTGTAPHGHSAQQAAASVPVARRTLIPSSGGTFRTLLTSTVGRSIGQVNTYDMAVPAGLSQLAVSFQTADVSADNVIGYYLVDPAGNLVATGSTPDTAAGQVPGTVTLTAPDPVAGTWEIDVELGVTVSGHEFTQTVHGTVSETG